MKSFLKKIENHIKDIIYDNGSNDLTATSHLLNLAALVYGEALKLRETLYKTSLCKSKHLACPVLSVGNLTLGGTGKTPLTIYLARLISGLGYFPVIISRGYGGSAGKNSGIVFDGKKLLMSAQEAGDEPWMMANALDNIPVIVGQNRFSAGLLAIKQFNPDLILLDDAFQHLQLARNLNLVLLDSRRPLGNGKIFPRGPLREPISALARADGIILTRDDLNQTQTNKFLLELADKLPVFRSTHQPCILQRLSCPSGLNNNCQKKTDAKLKDAKVFLFSGLANNAQFEKTITNLGCRIMGIASFADHHWYEPEDLKNIFSAAIKSGADFLLTTEKDYVRLNKWTEWPIELIVVGLKLKFIDGSFDIFIKNRLEQLFV